MPDDIDKALAWRSVETIQCDESIGLISFGMQAAPGDVQLNQMPGAYCEGLFRTEDGLIQLDADKLRKQAHFATATRERNVVSDRAGRPLEEAACGTLCFVQRWRALMNASE